MRNLRLFLPALLLGACSWNLPVLPGACPVASGLAAQLPASLVGGQAIAPLNWQLAGATQGVTQESPLAGATVTLADAANNTLPGNPTTTSPTGAFDMRGVPAGFAFQVVANKTLPNGKTITLKSLAQSTTEGADIDLNVATTVLTTALLQGHTGMLGGFDPSVFKQAEALVYTHLASITNLDESDQAGLLSQFSSWLTTDPQLAKLYSQLRLSLSSASPNYDQVVAALATLAGQTPPSGLSPLPSPVFASPVPVATGATVVSPTPVASASPQPSSLPTSPAPTTQPSSPASVAPGGPPTGVVTTFAGGNGTADVDGPVATALFDNIRGIAADDIGNVYLAEGNGHRIRQIDPLGMVTTLAGQGSSGFADGAGLGARFGYLAGMCLANNKLYVADSDNQRIRVVDLGSSEHNVTTLAGDGGIGHHDGAGLNARFNTPNALSFDAHTGNLYVVEYSSVDLRQITPDGTVSTIAGVVGQAGYLDGIGSQALFWNPSQAVVGPDEKLYVADSANRLVRTVDLKDPVFSVSTFVGNPPPTGPAKQPLTSTYMEGTGTGAQLARLTGLAYDARGFYVIADTNNNRVRTISPSGTTTLLAGTGSSGTTNGPGVAATFEQPSLVACGGGAIYVVDGNGGTSVRKIQ